MFAYLLSDRFDPFYQNISSFPTVVFTFVMLLCVLYWLVAIIGLVEIDVLDMDVDMDIDLGNADAGTDARFTLNGLLHRFRLTGIPVTVILTVVSLIAWLVCYYLVYLLFRIIPDGYLEILVGFPILIVSLFAGFYVTALVISPIRKILLKNQREEIKHIIGQSVVVRSSQVNNQFGEGFLNDGAAGLILKIRTTNDEVFKKGDTVVILEHIKSENYYRVISEQEFNN